MCARCFSKLSVIALILLTVRKRKFCQRFIKLIRLSYIPCNHRGVSRFSMCQGQRPATQTAVCFHPFGAGSVWVKLIAALHVTKLPDIEFGTANNSPT